MVNWRAVGQRAPLVFVASLLSWAILTDLVSISIIYWLLSARSFGVAALLFLLGSGISSLCLWSLAVVVARGPGYVDAKASEAGPAAGQTDGLGSDTDAGQPLLPQHTDALGADDESASTRHSSDSASSSDGDSDSDSSGGNSSWEDTSAQESSSKDDNIPLSALMHTASREVSSFVDHAAPYVERVGHGQLPSIHSHSHSHSQSHQTPAFSGSSLTAKANGQPRFCRKCQSYKPDRAHHCSTCGKCVLMLDHHCVVIGSCVGHANRKAFVLFLGYTCLLCLYTALATLFTLVDYLGREATGYLLEPLNWAALFIFSLIFGAVLTGFTIFHLYLCSKNKTTLENMESTRIKPDTSASRHQPRRTSTNWEEVRSLRRAAKRNHPFDMGWRQNFMQVFGGGSKWWSPFIPSGRITGDGYTFPVNRRKLDKLKAISASMARS